MPYGPPEGSQGRYGAAITAPYGPQESSIGLSGPSRAGGGRRSVDLLASDMDRISMQEKEREIERGNRRLREEREEVEREKQRLAADRRRWFEEQERMSVAGSERPQPTYTLEDRR